jgi:hypothetical protein
MGTTISHIARTASSVTLIYFWATLVSLSLTTAILAAAVYVR